MILARKPSLFAIARSVDIFQSVRRSTLLRSDCAIPILDASVVWLRPRRSRCRIADTHPNVWYNVLHRGGDLMATNLQLDDRLIDEAVRLGEHKSKKDAVTQALIEYTQRLRQLDLLDLFGTIDYDDDWDYKAQRRVS